MKGKKAKGSWEGGLGRMWVGKGDRKPKTLTDTEVASPEM